VKIKKTNKQDIEWGRVCSELVRDSVRVRVPRAFLYTLTLFFHHASDAMAGDDRPDHGLAKMRQDREHYKEPFYFLYAKLRQAQKKMSQADMRRALQTLQRYRELLDKREKQFRARLKLKDRKA
jgi:hypothetical protein